MTATTAASTPADGAPLPSSTGPAGLDDTAPDLVAVTAAVASVDDPEYPGLSIVDLGLVERVDVDNIGTVRVDLVPTFSGCPALSVIAGDVEGAVSAVDGVQAVQVQWLAEPIWTTDRVSGHGLAILAEEFTVAVEIGRRSPRCPRCETPLQPQSMFGPSRCRAVSRCPSCSETVEVMRA